MHLQFTSENNLTANFQLQSYSHKLVYRVEPLQHRICSNTDNVGRVFQLSLMPYTGWNQFSTRSVCSTMDNMERLHTVVVIYPTYRVESVQHIICGIKDSIGQGYSSSHVFHIQGGISPVHYLRLSGQYGKL